MGTALFWVITQRVVAISYREITTTRRVMAQKTEVPSYFAADAANHVIRKG